MSVHVVDAPPQYRDLLALIPEGVIFSARLSENTAIAHIFVTQKADLARILKSFRTKIKPDTAVWVSWPKKTAKVATDITEDTIREIALPMGYVDIKVCAVDAVWSGLKLVIRKALR